MDKVCMYQTDLDKLNLKIQGIDKVCIHQTDPKNKEVTIEEEEMELR